MYLYVFLYLCVNLFCVNMCARDRREGESGNCAYVCIITENNAANICMRVFVCMSVLVYVCMCVRKDGVYAHNRDDERESKRHTYEYM